MWQRAKENQNFKGIQDLNLVLQFGLCTDEVYYRRTVSSGLHAIKFG